MSQIAVFSSEGASFVYGDLVCEWESKTSALVERNEKVTAVIGDQNTAKMFSFIVVSLATLIFNIQTVVTFIQHPELINAYTICGVIVMIVIAFYTCHLVLSKVLDPFVCLVVQPFVKFVLLRQQKKIKQQIYEFRGRVDRLMELEETRKRLRFTRSIFQTLEESDNLELIEQEAAEIKRLRCELDRKLN